MAASDAIVVGEDWISEHYFTTDAKTQSFAARVVERPVHRLVRGGLLQHRSGVVRGDNGDLGDRGMWDSARHAGALRGRKRGRRASMIRALGRKARKASPHV